MSARCNPTMRTRRLQPQRRRLWQLRWGGGRAATLSQCGAAFVAGQQTMPRKGLKNFPSTAGSSDIVGGSMGLGLAELAMGVAGHVLTALFCWTTAAECASSMPFEGFASSWANACSSNASWLKFAGSSTARCAERCTRTLSGGAASIRAKEVVFERSPCALHGDPSAGLWEGRLAAIAGGFSKPSPQNLSSGCETREAALLGGRAQVRHSLWSVLQRRCRGGG
jgi:hypothetical protein